MPVFRKRKPVVRRKRRMPRQMKKKFRRTRFPRQLGPTLPEHLTTKLTYCIGQIGTSTTTTAGGQIFYINNMYDILSDSSLKQPRFYDQLSAMYVRHRVNAIRWELEFSPLTGTSYLAVGCLPHDYSPPATNLKAFQEDYRYKIYITSTNRGPIKVKGFRSIASIDDVTKRQIHDDDSYSAETNQAVAFKPTLRTYWQSLDETQSYGHWLQGRLTFYATFYQLKLPVAS